MDRTQAGEVKARCSTLELRVREVIGPRTFQMLAHGSDPADGTRRSCSPAADAADPVSSRPRPLGLFSLLDVWSHRESHPGFEHAMLA